jgi:hypothetical protein
MFTITFFQIPSKESDLPKNQHIAQPYYQQRTKLYKLHPQLNLMFPHKLAPKLKRSPRIPKNNSKSNIIQPTNTQLNLQNITTQINLQPTIIPMHLDHLGLISRLLNLFHAKSHNPHNEHATLYNEHNLTQLEIKRLDIE